MAKKSHFYDASSNTYANNFSFLGCPLSRELDESVDVVIIGVPYDLATSGRSGTRFGPSGIRQASAHLRWEKKRWPWNFSLAERLSVIDYGDICFDDGDSANMMAEVTGVADQIFGAGKTLLTLGGDHFVTLPLLRAAAKYHGKMALLHFDAHTDTEISDLDYYHGSMFYHAPKEGLIDPARSLQLGIRTEYEIDEHPFTVLDATWTNNNSVDDAVRRIRSVVEGLPIYLSFDIDCLDPAYAPGTGTPVIGGISSDKALQIIRGLSGLNIVAMDLMEVAPAYDHADITSLAGATLAWEMLHLVASRP